MRLSGNTVLITGGTSGIGYALASQLLRRGNAVIVTGRDPARLEEARRSLPGLHTIASDVSDPDAVQSLCNSVLDRFPAMNVLVNNAGIMRKINLAAPGADPHDLCREIDTNLSGMVRMVAAFLPLLKGQDNAAIVNVSSGLAFVPLPIAPIYCASKAGVHSFTQSLRVQLEDTGIRVFELAPPMTDTALFTKDIHAGDVKGIPLMNVSRMVDRALKALEKDHFEIRPGLSNILKLMSRVAPQFMLRRLSKSLKPSGG